MCTYSQQLASATDARSQYPLNAGIYKLEERLLDAKDTLHEFHKIQQYKVKGIDPKLRHCTKAEIPDWVTNQVLDVPRVVGYDILPAIEAAVESESLRIADSTEALMLDHLQAIQDLFDQIYPSLGRVVTKEPLDPRIVWLFKRVEALIEQVLP